MRFIPTEIPDVQLIEPEMLGDQRGFFMEIYHARIYNQAGIDAVFVQDNQSGSRRGSLRGLHYQICHPQSKLIRVVHGEVFDVAVDIRRSSPTFGRWVGRHLSSENRLQIYIPVGFAHGIYVLSDWAEVTYKVSDFYAPECERTLLWNDPQVNVTWPLFDGEPPVLSEKDVRGATLENADLFE